MLKRYLFSVLTLLFAGSLFANCGSGPSNCGSQCGDCEPICGDCGCGWNWQIAAEFLYFHPSFDDTYFVIQNNVAAAVPTGTRLNNDFNFRPGFRVGAAVELCGCCDGVLEGYYARVSADHSRTVSDGFLWATLGSPAITSDLESYVGSASSDLDYLYQRADAFYGQQIWCNECSDFIGLFGIEFAYVRLREQIDYLSVDTVAPEAQINNKFRTWGIGPQFGFKYDYLICEFNCLCPGALTFAANTSVSLLASRTDMRTSSLSDGVTVFQVQDEYTWRIIPALHARVAFNYATTICSWGTCVEIGYEFSSYIRAATHYVFPDELGDGFTATRYSNFDIQGLYIAVAVSF